MSTLSTLSTPSTTNTRRAIAASFLAMMCWTSAAQSKVPAAEVAKLGAELTPLGAIRAGNADGTIPAWEGGITSPPASYQPGIHHPDPFPADQPLFTITAANVNQYQANLSPGQVALFERYPETFRMPVYETRRTASLPQRIYDRSIANAASAQLNEDGNGVLDSGEGVPFPIPQSGLEGIWNHLLRYRGDTVYRVTGQAVPTVNGAYTMVKIVENMLWSYSLRGVSTDTIDNKLGYFLQEVTSPPRLAGSVLLVHETLNQAAEPRKAWIYNPGSRRVRRAPQVAYDNPGTASDGQRTSDQYDMYNGAPDRYHWELVGRRELYIPYNSYRLHNPANTFDDIIRPGHINPDLTRYELHRVWVVEATLKEGANHIYARRTFHLDEDSWLVSIIDQYDGRGEIWRVNEAHLINYYEVPLTWDTALTMYDLQNGRYLVNGLSNEYEIRTFNHPLSINQFTPEALRRKGRR